jgi:recombination protein RecT
MESKIKTPTNTAAMTAQAAAPVARTPSARASIKNIMDQVLDGEGYRKRFTELLGERTPQFVSSIVSMVNGSDKLKQAFIAAPETVIQSALKAATYDLPIDPTLGFAYIVPFRNSKANRMEASFIPGYKGLLQLAFRSGVYKQINAVEFREGELKHFDPLTNEIEYQFVDDEEEREKLTVTGYVAYFKLINGMEKYVYMSKRQVEAHERKHRKGAYMSPLWSSDFDAMALKTVLRRLISKWGVMSVAYQKNDAASTAAMNALNEEIDTDVIDTEFIANYDDASEGGEQE